MARPETGHTDENLQFCAYCASPITVGTKHPVFTDASTDGDVVLYTFCDATCNAVWYVHRRRSELDE